MWEKLDAATARPDTEATPFGHDTIYRIHCFQQIVLSISLSVGTGGTGSEDRLRLLSGWGQSIWATLDLLHNLLSLRHEISNLQDSNDNVQ